MRFGVHPAAAPRLLLAMALLAALAAPGRAAPQPGKGNRAAAATGPRVESARAVLGGTLRLVAAPRPDVTDPTRASAAAALALDEAVRLESIFGAGPGGELARLNGAAADERTTCSPELFAALDSAVALAEETEGAYDPTAAPLERLWAGAPAPERSALAAARVLVGWRMLRLEPARRNVRFLKPGMSVSLDDVASGCILDRVAVILRRRGIVRARLELEDVALAFTTHEPWTIAVSDWAGRPAVSLALANAACATVTTADEASPLVDPRTGEPVRGPLGVAVVAPTAARAGALARALLVMGRDGAEAYARAHPGLGVLWLEPAGDPASLRAWAWNLGALAADPSVRLEWMTRP